MANIRPRVIFIANKQLFNDPQFPLVTLVYFKSGLRLREDNVCCFWFNPHFQHERNIFKFHRLQKSRALDQLANLVP